MAKIKGYKQFIENVAHRNYKPYVKRFKELAGIETEFKATYLIEITFDFGESLHEHKSIKQFKKTKNRYFFHPQSTYPPVKAHYHVVGPRDKKEIYAINVDGTAHHQKNKGIQIPTKEAEELRNLGVQLSRNNIIEHLGFLPMAEKKLLLESLSRDCMTIYVEITEG